MRSIKKFTAAAVAVSLASTLFGCTPTIGSGTKTALTVGGYEVPAGMFIYYSMQGYSEAASVLQNQNGETPKLKDVRNAKIDSIDSTDWIQNKAAEYCIDFAGIQCEFDAIGGTLTQEDIDSAAEIAEYYYAQDSRFTQNGVSLDTMKKIIEMSYKEQAIFKHYYGFDGTEGCSEDELKDYFDDNFARVKYVSISLNDEEGEKVSPDKERELRNMAEKYAKQINAKSGDLNKLDEMNKVIDDYNEYLAKQTTTSEEEAEVTTTTTTTTTATDTETTTTTTTDPHANERLIQKATTTAAENVSNTSDSETETSEPAEESEDEKNVRLFNEYLFNELPIGKAQVYDYSDDTIYVVIRADLRERMTDDDLWSENYINNLLNMRYFDEFTEMLDAKTDVLTVEKNKSAYRRYAPFKLVLETT